jgi:hypothetical protein
MGDRPKIEGQSHVLSGVRDNPTSGLPDEQGLFPLANLKMNGMPGGGVPGRNQNRKNMFDNYARI